VLEAHTQDGGGHSTPIDADSIVAFFGLDQAGPDPQIAACGPKGDGSGDGAGFLGVPELIRYAPARTISIPNKHYWLLPEHRDEAARKLALWSNVQGAAVNLLMITLQLVLPPRASWLAADTPVLAVVLVGFGAFTLGWMIWLSLAYRLPVDVEG